MAARKSARSASPSRPGDAAVVERLYDVIRGRRGADPDKSYVARLYAKGRPKIAQKVGEEGVETALAAVTGSKKDLVSESADLLFMLLVLWADCGVKPAQVFAELERREGRSGIDEKKSRADRRVSAKR